MDRFLKKLERKIGAIFYGRNGVDSLNRALLLGLVLASLIQLFFRDKTVLSVLSLGLSLVILYRLFSKDLGKRRLENQKFLASIQPLRKNTNKWKGRIGARKTTAFFKCPKCKKEFKAPKNLGKIKVTCKNCGHEFIQKT